jgi:YHS domain-containing protein
METLASLVLLAAVVVLMMRFGCGAHLTGRRRKPAHDRGERIPGDGELRWVPPENDRDPVCGKTVATAEAKPSVHGGHVHYFCSRECREAFEAAPDSYVSRAESRALRRPEHSHG